jgi:hypothetical protein
MDRIKRTAAILQPMLVIFAVLYIWLSAGGTLDYALLSPQLWMDSYWVHPDAQIATTTRVVYLIMWLLPVVFGLLATAVAIALLRLVQRGVLFDTRIAARFRLVGFSVAASGATDLWAEFWTPVVMSWHNPDGLMPPSSYFDSVAAGNFLLGGGFYLVGWIMAEAITVARDNEGFI